MIKSHACEKVRVGSNICTDLKSSGFIYKTNVAEQVLKLAAHVFHHL